MELGQADKGSKCASSELENGSVLPSEVLSANMPTFMADGGGPSLSTLLEFDESVPDNLININLEDDLLAGFNQEGLSLSFNTGGSEHELMLQDVGFQGQTSIPNYANPLTNDQDGTTLTHLMGNKSNELGQASEVHACPSELKDELLLGPDVHRKNEPRVMLDGNGSSSSKPIEEESVLHGGLAEPTDMDVD